MSIRGTIQLVTSRSRQFAFAGILAGGTVLPAATTAHAAVVAASCTGTQSSTYTPGLTNTPRPVTVSAKGDLTCASTTDPSITAATTTVSVTATASCTSGAGSGTRTIQWSNGRTSTLQVTATLSVNPSGQSIVTIGGRVAAGEFAGGAWSGVVTLLSANPLVCGSALGLTASTGPIQLTIVFP